MGGGGGTYLVVGKGGVLGKAGYQGGGSVHVIDQAIHQLIEAIPSTQLQGRAEHHIWDPEVQLGLEQRGHARLLVCKNKKKRVQDGTRSH